MAEEILLCVPLHSTESHDMLNQQALPQDVMQLFHRCASLHDWNVANQIVMWQSVLHAS